MIVFHKQGKFKIVYFDTMSISEAYYTMERYEDAGYYADSRRLFR